MKVSRYNLLYNSENGELLSVACAQSKTQQNVWTDLSGEFFAVFFC